MGLNAISCPRIHEYYFIGQEIAFKPMQDKGSLYCIKVALLKCILSDSAYKNISNFWKACISELFIQQAWYNNTNKYTRGTILSLLFFFSSCLHSSLSVLVSHTWNPSLSQPVCQAVLRDERRQLVTSDEGTGERCVEPSPVVCLPLLWIHKYTNTDTNTSVVGAPMMTGAPPWGGAVSSP